MGKYKSLVSNTFVFALSGFGAKLLSFLLLPLLTYLLDPGQLSLAKTAIYTCNLILPLMYLCISEAVIRFGLDASTSRKDLFTCGILTVLGGFMVVQLAMPLMGGVAFVAGFEHLIRIYVLTSAAHTVVTHFVRASGLVRIFAIDGLLTSVYTLSFIYIFLFRFELGAQGYVLATICADALSVIGLFLFLKLYRFIKLKKLNFTLWKTMLKYSIPLVPTSIFWWVTNLSDRYFVITFHGQEINGIYDAAATIPMAIVAFSDIFTKAWQISAFSEYGGTKAERERFYSTVFRSYYTLVFLAASGIIMLVRPVTILMMDGKYHEAWQYTPMLVIAVSFSCFVTFLGTVYNAARHNAMITVTTFIGAALNILLNWLLIPSYGAQGAAFATFISYSAVFIIRAVDSRRYIRINMQPQRMAMNLALLLLQVFLLLRPLPLWLLWQIIIFLMLALCNMGYIMSMAKRFLSMAKSRRRE